MTEYEKKISNYAAWESDHITNRNFNGYQVGQEYRDKRLNNPVQLHQEITTSSNARRRYLEYLKAHREEAMNLKNSAYFSEIAKEALVEEENLIDAVLYVGIGVCKLFDFVGKKICDLILGEEEIVEEKEEEKKKTR